MEAGFDSLNRTVSAKTIENWLSGHVMPSRNKIHVLSRLFSGDDRRLQKLWLDAMLDARRRRSGKTDPQRSAAASPAAPHTGTSASGDVLSDAPPASARLAWPVILTAGALCLAGLATLALVLPRMGENSRFVHDIRFCEQSGFDEDARRCVSSRNRFAAGTRKVMVSFEDRNVTPGQPFERRWYRNGEMFLQRDGFFDEVWEGWTWLENPNGHDPGRYHLRVIVDGKVATAGFEIDGPAGP